MVRTGWSVCTVTFPPVLIDHTDHVMSSSDYHSVSVSRDCAKTYLGNTCRRDWLGRPDITCITTCSTDYCNCDRRSPPPDMFKNGKPLPEAPEYARYYKKDMESCPKISSIPSKKRIHVVKNIHVFKNTCSLLYCKYFALSLAIFFHVC